MRILASTLKPGTDKPKYDWKTPSSTFYQSPIERTEIYGKFLQWVGKFTISHIRFEITIDCDLSSV